MKFKPAAYAPFSVLPLLCATSVGAQSTYTPGDVRFGNVVVSGVSIENLNPVEARRRLTRELDKKLDATHVLSDGVRTAVRRRRDLGVSIDIERIFARAGRGETAIPVLFWVNETVLLGALKRLAPHFTVEERNARVGMWQGKAVIAPERNGQTVNLGASVPALAGQIEEKPAERILPLRLRTTKPRLTKAKLNGIDGIIGSFTTEYAASNEKRTTNMRVAIKAIDGALLSPNEVFSLNKTVGERTQARGYRTAIVFENGYKVLGIGGGVSQVTGTLFNAALMANLPIVSYQTHSRPVAYLPLGRDATVAWGQFDMKFKNNTGAPIYIAYAIKNRTITATLYGKSVPGRKVSVRVTSREIGPREITAVLYRTVREAGKTARRERVGSSHYKWKDGKPED